MAKPKVKVRKGKMTCPVCGWKITGQYGKSRKYIIFRKYECVNPVCGYAFYSESSRAMEFIGASSIEVEVEPTCLKPGLEDLRRDIERHLRKRNQLLREAREIVHDPEYHLICECIERPGSDIPELSKAMLTWLEDQGRKREGRKIRKFPNTIKSVKRRIKRDANLQTRRSAHSQDRHGDGGLDARAGGGQ